MNKLFFAFAIVLFITGTACNSEGKATDLSQTDSLQKEVLHEHDEAMAAQMTKMRRARTGIENLLDSIGKLPARAQETASAYKSKLDSVMHDLDEADSAMMVWMDEFSLDSLKNNTAERIKYLAEEKLKVSKVKKAILSSVEKADSVLQEKF